MNAQDEEDFVFACLLGAYIYSIRQQEGQQQLQRGTAIVQQAGRRRRRRMRRPRSIWVREWLSEYRRQQLGHYSTFLTQRAPHRRCQDLPELSEDASRTFRRDPGKNNTSHRETRHEVPLCPTTWTEAVQ